MGWGGAGWGLLWRGAGAEGGQVFEHVYEMEAAAAGLAGALGAGGRLVWTGPFVEPHHEGPAFRDYWRFTPLAAARLLSAAGLRVPAPHQPQPPPNA